MIILEVILNLTVVAVVLDLAARLLTILGGAYLFLLFG